MRYNSDIIPACASVSSCNGIGNVFLTSYYGLENLHGRNALNEAGRDEYVSIDNIIVSWINAGYIGGSPGSMISMVLLDAGHGTKRVILKDEPVYLEFDFQQRGRLVDFLTGPHANEYGIIRCFVAELVSGDGVVDWVDTSPHFISFFKIAESEDMNIPAGETDGNLGVEWVFFGGELGSTPLRIKHRNLFDLLCTHAGTMALANGLSGPYGEGMRVTFVRPGRMANPTSLFGENPADAYLDADGSVLDPDPFVVLPKVQLRPRDVAPVEETRRELMRRHPWTVVNGTASFNRMHAIQVIDGITVGSPHNDIRDLDRDLPTR